MASANHGKELPHIMPPTPVEQMDNVRTGALYLSRSSFVGGAGLARSSPGLFSVS